FEVRDSDQVGFESLYIEAWPEYIEAGSDQGAIQVTRSMKISITDCWIVGNNYGWPSVSAHATVLRIADSHFTGGGIWIRDGSNRVLIENNEISSGVGTGIGLGGLSEEDTVWLLPGNFTDIPLSEKDAEWLLLGDFENLSPYPQYTQFTGISVVRIVDNFIHDMDNSGISTLASSSYLGNALGDIEDVVIAHNRIIGCAKKGADARFEPEAVGGIVLREASQVHIHDNHIMGNGADNQVPACGIFTFLCQELEITDNKVMDNGLTQQEVETECIDFSRLKDGNNPRDERGVEFEVLDRAGNRMNGTVISSILDVFRGLDCGYHTYIRLPMPSDSVELTLVHSSSAPTIEAINVDNVVVGTATMSEAGGQPETFSFAGVAIQEVRILAPEYGTRLLEFCSQARRMRCVDFMGMAPDSGYNPRIEDGVSFLVQDYEGDSPDETEFMSITDTNGEDLNGLSCNRTTEIKLPFPSISVELELISGQQIYSGQQMRIEAFYNDAPVDERNMTAGPNEAQTFRITGNAINRVVIYNPQDEAALLRFCFAVEDAVYQAAIAAVFVTSEESLGSEFRTWAARIHDNIAICPRGRSLLAIGAGSMSIADNTLISHGLWEGIDPVSQLTEVGEYYRQGQCVLVVNIDQERVAAEYSVARNEFTIRAALVDVVSNAGDLNYTELVVVDGEEYDPTITAADPELPILVFVPGAPSRSPDGRVMFHGNQVTLQTEYVDSDQPAGYAGNSIANLNYRGLELYISSAVTIISDDDVSLQDNQFLTEAAGRIEFASVIVESITARATGNRFIEPPRQTFWSYISSAHMIITTNNQATHCIGSDGVHVIDDPNQIMYSSYCTWLAPLLRTIWRES
ncbi:right-handed parallel beta-helix repeat-containing protein, partial [Candidatus Poribacteria bacterium]